MTDRADEKIHYNKESMKAMLSFVDGFIADYERQEAEIARLNKWADGFSDAQLKERALSEEVIKELRKAVREMAEKLDGLKSYGAEDRKCPICNVNPVAINVYIDEVLETHSSTIQQAQND